MKTSNERTEDITNESTALTILGNGLVKQTALVITLFLDTRINLI